MLRISHSHKVVQAALVVLVGYIAGLFLVWRGNPAVTAENALLENLQVGALVVACLLLIPCLVKPAATISRFACWCLLLALLSMVLREVDVETLEFAQPIAWIGSGLGRNLSLGGAFVATAIVLFYRRRELFGPLLEFVFSVTGMLLFIGCLLYLLSLPLDKHLFGLSRELNQFGEESIECGATLMFLLASAHNLVRYFAAIRANPRQQPTPLPASSLRPEQA